MLQKADNLVRRFPRSPNPLRGSNLSRSLSSWALFALLAVVVAAACADGGAPPANEDTAAAGEEGGDGTARLATLPSEGEEGQGAQLPPGHPSLDPGAAAATIPPPPPGSGSGANALEWAVPEGWQEVPPASSMRRAQYRVPGPGGDGEMVVFYFGPGQGGTAQANAQRWAGQFQGPDGGPAPMESHEMELGGRKVMMVEVTGTYSGGMAMMGAPSQSLEDYMLLGAIAEGPDANWFFKLTGPQATLEAQREAFEQMIQSLHPAS